MKTHTLASAFQAALARTRPDGVADATSPREDLLLAALQRSVTGMDAIVQRRIGANPQSACPATQ